MSESRDSGDCPSLEDSVPTWSEWIPLVKEPRELSDEAFRTEGTPVSSAAERKRPPYRPYRLKLSVSVPLEFE